MRSCPGTGTYPDRLSQTRKTSEAWNDSRSSALSIERLAAPDSVEKDRQVPTISPADPRHVSIDESRHHSLRRQATASQAANSGVIVDVRVDPAPVRNRQRLVRGCPDLPQTGGDA